MDSKYIITHTNYIKIKIKNKKYQKYKKKMYENMKICSYKENRNVNETTKRKWEKIYEIYANI